MSSSPDGRTERDEAGTGGFRGPGKRQRFSREEMERRRALTDDLMARESLDALVLFGQPGRHAGTCWLTEYRPLVACYLVVLREGDATLLVPWLNHVPNAREVSSVSTEWAGDSPMDAVASILKGAHARRVGLVADGAFGAGMPYADKLRVNELLASAELTDCTRAFMELQLVKSAEEIERMRTAAAFTDLALETIAGEASPGVTEFELVARAERSYREQGADVWISFLRSMPMDAPTGCVPAQRLSGRRLEQGDVIISELSAMWTGYLGQVLWPVFVGAEPTGEWERMMDAGVETFTALSSVVRHGASVADAVAAAEPIKREGYTICDSLLHGIGMGISQPHAGRAELEGDAEDLSARFERGMGVVLQPNPITRDERMGLQMGAAGIVRDDGVEFLHRVPTRALIAA